MAKSLIRLKQLDQTELTAFVTSLIQALGVGGGTGAAIYTATETDPSTVSPSIPTEVLLPAIYYSSVDLSFWIFKVGTGWQPLIQ